MSLPAAAATPQKLLSGTNGMVGITVSGGSSTQFPITQFNATYAVTLDDTTNSSLGGWQGRTAGIQSINGTLTFIYDLANNPNISPYKLVPGTVSTVTLILDGQNTANNLGSDTLGTETYSGPAIMGKFHFKSGPQAGACECTVDFESTGAWTVPAA